MNVIITHPKQHCKLQGCMHFYRSQNYLNRKISERKVSHRAAFMLMTSALVFWASACSVFTQALSFSVKQRE